MGRRHDITDERAGIQHGSNEKRLQFGVFMHLYPDLLQDEEKFTNYFKMALVFFKMLTC
jgi:hypothetical protein